MGEEVFVKNQEKYKCPKCKDSGIIYRKGKFVACDSPVHRLAVNNIDFDEEKYNQLVDEILPEEYRDLVFDYKKILNDNSIEPFIRKEPEFKYYLEMLNEIYNKINIGEKLKYSILVTAPQGLGKAHWVYSCLNAALKAGLSVAPYYDVLEIYNYLMVPDSKEYIKILERVYQADICFLKIPTGLTIQKSMTQTLKLVVDRRARKALPTIVVSRFPVNYIYATEVNLDRFIITGNYSNERDYSRLRVIASPFPNLQEYTNKYIKRSR